MYDFEKMSISELLAVVLQADVEGETIKELSVRYLTAKNLYQASLEELLDVNGIGTQKALLLKSILELGIRIVSAPRDETPALTSPTDVLRLLSPRMEYLDRENFIAVLLNTKNRVISVETVSIGSLNSSIVHPREIFKNAVRLSAASVILAHNHPSGDPTPSREDLEITKRLAEAGKLIGIEVLDHIVIGVNAFTSFKEQGLI